MNKPADVLAQLSHNESLIAELYRAYALKFPNLKDFWSLLEGEEMKHAGWLNHMSRSVEEKSATLTGRFSSPAIKSFHAYMNREIAAVPAKGFTMEQAFATALYLEKSLIEKDFFRSLTNLGPKETELLEALIEESKEHLALIQQKIRDRGLKVK